MLNGKNKNNKENLPRGVFSQCVTINKCVILYQSSISDALSVYSFTLATPIRHLPVIEIK